MTTWQEKMKEIVKSTMTYGLVKDIGQKFSLDLDQLGELDAEIRNVLLGVTKSENFTKNIRGKLEIEYTVAQSITKEVNEKILEVIKEKIKKETSKDSQSVTDLERIGGFTIEKEDMANSNDTTNEGMYVEKRPEILAGLENPPTSDALVDHLLTIPTIIPPEHITSSPLTKSDVTATPTPKPTSDPYKEPIN